MAKTAFLRQPLDFPPWTVQFDGRGYLYVGGGGGDQKEVKNKLAVFDVSSRHQLSQVAEVSINDDSVSSLDVLPTGPDSAVIFGAVNSNKASKAKGTNEHLRSWNVKLPKRKQDTEKAQEVGQITPVAQTRLFSKSYVQSEGFQRITRLSRVRSRNGKAGSKRLGVIASSLSPESEIIVFRATTASPGPSDIIQKITPIENREANDLDLIEGDQAGDYNLVLATNHEVYYLPLHLDPDTLKPKHPLSEAACIWSSPLPDAFEKRGTRPKYRSIQYLSPTLVCLLANVGSTSELQLLQIFGQGSAEITLRKKLPKSVGSAVNMTVSLLDADPNTGEYQAVVAVAAQKSNALVYTVDLPGHQKPFRSSFKLYQELSVSDAPMRAARLSPFFSPWPSSSSGVVKTPGPQYLRLASISLHSHVTVDFLPLQPVDSKPGSRYVLQKASGRAIGGISVNYLIIGFIVVVQLLLVQSYYSQQHGGGASPQLLPKSWQDALAAYRERAMLMGSPLTRQVDRVTHTHTGQKIVSLLHSHHEDSKHLPDPAKKAIILSAPEEGTELNTEVHESTADVLKQDANAKKWEELSDTEQQQWKEKLKKAGAWSADYGETIFKGVFFSELAGAVGRAAAEAIGG